MNCTNKQVKRNLKPLSKFGKGRNSSQHTSKQELTPILVYVAHTLLQELKHVDYLVEQLHGVLERTYKISLPASLDDSSWQTLERSLSTQTFLRLKLVLSLISRLRNDLLRHSTMAEIYTRKMQPISLRSKRRR